MTQSASKDMADAANSLNFKKNDSKVSIGTEEIKALSRQADYPTEEEVSKEVERNLRLLMHMCKTGVQKPRAQYKSVTTRSGKQKLIDTSLGTIKNTIAQGFQRRQ